MSRCLLVVLVFAGCVTRSVDDAPPFTITEHRMTFLQSIDKDLDILFVVDNSDSMEHEQASLAKNFPLLIDALRSHRLGKDNSGKPCSATNRAGCVLPNVRIGVISTDLGAGNYTNLPSCGVSGGDNGKLQNSPRIAGCVPPNAGFIEYNDGMTNIDSEVVDPVEAVKQSFECIAKLGTGGCGFEQPLEAARRALDPQLGLNPRFVRDDALLAVVFITDEDDCSASDPQLFDPSRIEMTDPLGPLAFRCFEFGVTCDINDRNKIGPRRNCRPAGKRLHDVQNRYVDFFKKLKPEGRIVVAAIAGQTDKVEVVHKSGGADLASSCTNANAAAAPAIRVRSVVDAFDDDGLFTSICKGDLGEALQQLGEKLHGKLGAQCLPSPVLTRSKSFACQSGDSYGTSGATCKQDCLHEASCEVIEGPMASVSTEGQRIEKCPSDLWYPTDWQKQRDCGSTCPCWRLVRKPKGAAEQYCDPLEHGSPYALDVLRRGEAPKGTAARVHCMGAEVAWGSDAANALRQCR